MCAALNLHTRRVCVCVCVCVCEVGWGCGVRGARAGCSRGRNGRMMCVRADDTHVLGVYRMSTHVCRLKALLKLADLT